MGLRCAPHFLGGNMQTSDKGRAFLERHEGMVLRAYRCPAGVWTIGPGLTAASGVVKPKAGMTITLDQGRALLAQALARRYEPAVAAAMRGAAQHEFDAGVSFHFNTGAIGRASWVKKWRFARSDRSGLRKAMRAWNKGGGKVLPGLERRREEEYSLLVNGVYSTTRPTARAGLARFAMPMTEAEIGAIRAAFASLGFDPGGDHRGVDQMAAAAFQTRYGLTVDGIIGRATLSTLQRALDARAKTQIASGTTAAGGIETSTSGVAEAVPEHLPDGLSDAVAAAPWLGPVLLGLGALWLAWLAFTYRDALAARIVLRFPRIAARLRSF